MASMTKSRWVDDEDDAAVQAQRRKDKEEKKKLKAEKQRRAQQIEEEKQRLDHEATEDQAERPNKRRRLSPEAGADSDSGTQVLRFLPSQWGPCRHVDNFEKLNHIEEGSYGWVSRAKEIATGEIVALKKLKMVPAIDGFPITGLREIQTLLASTHPNVVDLREVVMGDSMSEYVTGLVLPTQLTQKSVSSSSWISWSMI